MQFSAAGLSAAGLYLFEGLTVEFLPHGFDRGCPEKEMANLIPGCRILSEGVSQTFDVGEKPARDALGGQVHKQRRQPDFSSKSATGGQIRC